MSVYVNFPGATLLLVVVMLLALGGSSAADTSCGMDTNHNKSSGQPAQVNYAEVYVSKYAKWCVDENFWPSISKYIKPFFAYYDYLVPRLSSLFNISIPLPVVFEATWPDGSACDCGPRFGEKESVVVTGDAFSNQFANPKNNQIIPGFWGYLLPMHEMINALTGQVGGGGWPADWWADHRSAFPNAMDIGVLNDLGTSHHNQTLLNAASAQYERFADPNLKSSYDPEVAMFIKFYNKYKFGAFSSFFGLVTGDGLQWNTITPNPLPDNNQSQRLSEYVIAYLSLAFGTTSDLTPTFTRAGVGLCVANWPCPPDIPYYLHSGEIRKIANAHCSIRAASAAGVNVSGQLAQLQHGNYLGAMATGGSSSSCPSECSWVRNECAAKW